MRTFDKQTLLKRVIYMALLVVCALLQHTKGAFFHLGAVHAWLLVPAVVAIAMHERSVPAMLFGALAGALWDYAAVGPDGFFTLWFAVLAFGVSTVVTFWVRNHLRAGLLLCFAALCLTALFYWFCFVVLPGQGGAGTVLLRFMLPGVLFTFLFSPLLYLAVHRTAVALSAGPRSV